MTPEQQGFMRGLLQTFLNGAVYRFVWTLPPRLLLALFVLGVAIMWAALS